MSPLRLVWRSLSYYWRAHLGTLLGAILAAAILTGALAVGDSVRYSLRQKALARIGKATLALTSPGRFFRASLAEGLASDLKALVAPLVVLPAAATDSTGELRAGNVQAIGADARFFALAPNASNSEQPADTVVLSPALASQLKAKAGDEIVLRVDKPSLLSRDAPLSTIEDATVALRLKVDRIATESEFAEFGLSANQLPALNAILPLAALQKAVGMESRANALLLGGDTNPADATSALWARWTLDDSGLELRENPSNLELRTTRVFLDPPVGEAALGAQPKTQGVLTYFVNGLKLGSRETPYSAVAAIDSPITQGLTDSEIAINAWLADDLGAKVGDEITVRYWIVGQQRRLEEKTAVLKIKRIVPLSGEAADPTLMPDIPGLSDKKNCREWEPGVPVDLNKIRDKDQAYWDRYRGAPKAFIPLAAGQKLWNNRFGNLTAVRYSIAGGKDSKNIVNTCIRQALSPASQGLFFQPLRERALAASGASTDFGGLFIGFSLFLLVSALLLAALLFSFSVERRRGELNTLRALGYSQGLIRRLVLTEGGILALLGSLIGAGLATFYTRAVISALSSIWSGAVAGAALQFHAEPITLLIGALASFATALVALWLATRPAKKPPPPPSISGFAGTGEPEGKHRNPPLLGGRGASLGTKKALIWPGILILLALGGAAFGATLSGQDAAGAAFGAGALLLIAGLLLARYWLRGRVVHGALAQRNAARRPGRSLAAISLLACGVFLVVAVGANQHDPRHDALEKSSGTGGFALYAEASLPIFEDLNTPGGREKYNLDEDGLKDTKIVALKLREGDEASCLNLNKAQTPRLLGVEPGALAGRFSGDWAALEKTAEDGSIPVIGDTNTVLWSLKKKPGDTLDYTDDRGLVHKLKIVGAVPNSTFQGSLIMSEAHFVKLFPERSGYRVFFVDAPEKNADAVRRELTRALEDSGLSVVPSGERLAAFQMVENTYLSVFAALGGLGLLLGSAGLGVIVLRNVEERRSELALLRAVGYEATHIQRLLLSEHALLLLIGLGIGTVSGILAILPSLKHAPPLGLLVLTLIAVLLSGLLWVVLAARAALRGPLLAALRSE